MTSLADIVPTSNHPGVDTGIFAPSYTATAPGTAPAMPIPPQGYPVQPPVTPAPPVVKRDWIMWLKQLLIMTAFFLAINNPVIDNVLDATDFTPTYRLLIKTTTFTVASGVCLLLI